MSETDTTLSRQKTHEEWMEAHYRDAPYDIGAVRSALGDAAGLCDAISTDIWEAVKPRTKLKVQRAKEVSDAVKAAGDAIWAMRDRIKPSSGETE